MIPYGHQNIDDDDIKAVTDVLSSEWITQGPITPKFEELIADYCGAGFGVAVNSATSALHLACLSLDVGPGDYVWTSPNTFVASANCALYCGAKIDFVDIDPFTYNMSIEELERKLESADKEGKLPKVIIPVHFAGQSCDMKSIKRLAEIYEFKIIEDASHAIGGKYFGSVIGDCKYSDITVFSFHPVKIITTGEGGMAVTNNFDLADKMSRLRSHGITRDKKVMNNYNKEEQWYYEQIQLGFNYRMTDIQAALGISQFKRLHSFIDKRKELVSNYNDKLCELSVITPFVGDGIDPAWHLYVIKVLGERTHIFELMRKMGVGVNVHYIPVHFQPYYQKLGFKMGQFPEAENYYKQALSLPLFPGLLPEQQEHVIDSLERVI